jgi:hypothetical protein
VNKLLKGVRSVYGRSLIDIRLDILEARKKEEHVEPDRPPDCYDGYAGIAHVGS